MYDQIQAQKPEGATHWRCGVYYKRVNPVEWYYWEEGVWRFTGHFNNFILELTKL